MLTLEKRERFLQKAQRIAERFSDPVQQVEFVTLIEEVLQEVYELEQSKATAQDVRLLIVEMREGFNRMDERFLALQKQMDERFNAMQKQMDERFTSFDKRFTSFQWLISFGFALVTLLLSYATLVKPSQDKAELRQLIEEIKNLR